MLVLTRKQGENIRIGSDVIITILGVRSGHVKIGIQAPRGVSVHREEVYDKIAEANRSAASSSTDAKEAAKAVRSQLGMSKDGGS